MVAVRVMVLIMRVLVLPLLVLQVQALLVQVPLLLLLPLPVLLLLLHGVWWAEACGYRSHDSHPAETGSGSGPRIGSLVHGPALRGEGAEGEGRRRVKLFQVQWALMHGLYHAHLSHPVETGSSSTPRIDSLVHRLMDRERRIKEEGGGREGGGKGMWEERSSSAAGFWNTGSHVS